jgi:hypothetical protein
MAWFQGPNEGFREGWDNQQERIWDRLTAGSVDANTDTKAAALFDAGVFHFGRDADNAQIALIRYLRDEYDIDFTTAMPWEEWRAWYEGRA